jgi:hypothetical protein
MELIKAVLDELGDDEKLILGLTGLSLFTGSLYYLVSKSDGQKVHTAREISSMRGLNTRVTI